jgi:3-hydroxyacyl-CoA dehydrogenase
MSTSTNTSTSKNNDKLIAKFNKAVELVKTVEYVSNENKLYLYAYYKQVNNGNNNLPKPSMFNMVDSAKWKAWNEISGMEKEEAMKLYINKVKELLRI